MPKGYQAREGYELWHPNREKAESKTTKAVVAFVLLISAALLVIITLGGWERLQSTTVGLMTIGWALLYVLFAFLVMRWNRGVLPVTAALAVIMIIFAAVAAGGWFARDKPGLDSPALPEDLLGLLTVIVIPVQLLLLMVVDGRLQSGLERRGGAADRRPAPRPPRAGPARPSPRHRRRGPQRPAAPRGKRRTAPDSKATRTTIGPTAPSRTPPSERSAQT